MAYMTPQEFLIKYDPQVVGRLTDDAGSDEVITATITVFLDDASGFIDSFLRNRYTLPLTGTYNELRRATGIIAYHDLRNRKTKGDDEVRNPEYEEVVEWLTMIKLGNINLGDGESIRTDISAYIDSETAIFTESKFRSY